MTMASWLARFRHGPSAGGPDENAPVARLRVLDGMQAGARTALARGVHKVGNHASADVRLELGAAPTTLVELRVSRRGLGVMLLQGQASAGGRPLVQYQPTELQGGMPLVLAGTPVEVQHRLHRRARPADATWRPSPRVRMAAGALATTALTLMALLGLSVVLPPAGSAVAGAQAFRPTQASQIQAVLDSLQLAHVQVVVDGSSLSLGGWVPTQAHLDGLAHALDARRLRATVNTVTLAALRERAGAYFRGLPAVGAIAVSAPADAGLRVELPVAEPGVQAAVAAARQLLTYEMPLPEVHIAVRSDSAASGEPVARIVLRRSADGRIDVTDPWSDMADPKDVLSWLIDVRQGALPSLVTREGGRYFAGSRLPNGALVLAIADSHVVLGRAGATRRFETAPPSAATDRARRGAGPVDAPVSVGRS